MLTMADALVPGVLRATKTSKIFFVFVSWDLHAFGSHSDPSRVGEAQGWRGQGDSRGSTRHDTTGAACGTRVESTQGSTSAMARYGGWTMKKLTVAYCEYSGSSRGAR